MKFDYEGVSSSDSEELKVDMDNPGQNFDFGPANDEDEFDFMCSGEEDKKGDPSTPNASLPKTEAPVPKPNEQSMHIPDDLLTMPKPSE